MGRGIRGNFRLANGETLEVKSLSIQHRSDVCRYDYHCPGDGIRRRGSVDVPLDATLNPAPPGQ